MPANLKNSRGGHRPGKRQFSFHCQRMVKLLHKVLISHATKVMLKILQARLQQYVNHKLPDIEAGFRKGRGTRDQIANIHWLIKKEREFQRIARRGKKGWERQEVSSRKLEMPREHFT